MYEVNYSVVESNVGLIQTSYFSKLWKIRNMPWACMFLPGSADSVTHPSILLDRFEVQIWLTVAATAAAFQTMV